MAVFLGIFIYPIHGTYAEPQPLAQSLERMSQELSPKDYLRYLRPEKYEYYSAIIQCESGWDSLAKNPNSTASGLGQFLSSTWKETNRRMGLETTPNVFDSKANIDAFVWLIEKDGNRHWLESKRCWNKYYADYTKGHKD